VAIIMAYQKNKPQWLIGGLLQADTRQLAVASIIGLIHKHNVCAIGDRK
jgi:hypothetical protein